jgi:hypothetical protein
MKTLKHPWMPLAIGAALAASFAWTERSEAFNPQPDPPRVRYDFGMAGLGRGETARLSAVNVDARGPARCVRLLFVDAAGTPLTTPHLVALGPGQSTSIDLPDAGLVRTGDGALSRVQVRGVVNLLPIDPCKAPNLEVPTMVVAERDVQKIPPPVGDFEALIPTMEVFHTESGRTVAVQPPVARRLH